MKLKRRRIIRVATKEPPPVDLSRLINLPDEILNQFLKECLPGITKEKLGDTTGTQKEKKFIADTYNDWAEKNGLPKQDFQQEEKPEEQQQKKSSNGKIPGYSKPDGVLPSEWKEIIELVAERQNIFLKGPAGCGKTYLAEKIAEAFGLRFHAISCSEGMDEGEFDGWRMPINGFKFDYVPAPWVDYYENGGVLLFDEFAAANDNLMSKANAAIGGKFFYLTKRVEKPLVKRHKDFVLIAADNTYGHGGDNIYSARNQLDGATLDRFWVVNMGYDPRVEKKVSDPEVYEWGKWIRKGIDALQLPRLMSTRTLINYSRMKQTHGWGLDKWEKFYFASWEKEDRERLHRWIIQKIEETKQSLEKKLAKEDNQGEANTTIEE